MIRLEVKDYCHNCPEFQPDVEHPHALRTGHGDVILSDTVIRCERTDICEIIYKRAKKEAEMLSFMAELTASRFLNDDSAENVISRPKEKES